jgi:undecaprenyl-diphosphatase
MLEIIVLACIQGFFEWLPVSSEGLIVLIGNNFFDTNLVDSVEIALFLHLGTFFAALIYYYKEVKKILHQLFNYPKLSEDNKNKIKFYIIASVASFVLGGIVYYTLPFLSEFGWNSGQSLNLIIGVLLLFTAYLQFKKSNNKGMKKIGDSSISDSLYVGLGQGFAALPGVSRSGTTTALLLIRNFGEEESLKISFLLSLPFVLAGNIVLQLNNFGFHITHIVGLLIACVIGLLTIHTLVSLARKVSFGWFVLFFGVLIIVGSLVI